MFTKEMKILLFAIGCIFTIQNAKAVNLQDGQYIWEFHSGMPWPGGYNQNTGKPKKLIYARDQYPDSFFDRIANALPESTVNEAFLTGDNGANITLQEDSEIFITFLHEGAGYQNAFGFFTFDSASPPTAVDQIGETIVFPNLSFPHLATGHRLSLGHFSAGTTIGFFLAANAFWYDTGVKPWESPFYYSLQDLNPDPTDKLRQHNVLLYDQVVDEVVIGFEDLPRSWGDNDFNDAVFSVKAASPTAIDTANLATMPSADDSDADGVADWEDEFPNDYRRAFSAFYPSANDWVTLAYEDNWPHMGDYDMNDLVVRERLQTTYNADGSISGFILDGFIDARGAAQHNGFALRLMGMSPDIIAQGSVTIDGQSFERSPEQWQSEAVLVLWQDSHVHTQTGESDSCSHFNTKKECATFDPVPFRLDIHFAYAPANLNHSELDFFIFKTDYRGREIHFANYPPTDLFDASQFGRYEDTSSPETGRYFKNSTNLPWALKVNTNWCYPREYIDVVWAYPEYEQWVESSGGLAVDWFHRSDRDTHFYCRADNTFKPLVAEIPVSKADQLSCEITFFNPWNNGYQLDLAVNNTSSTNIDGWQVTLQFEEAPEIVNSWSSSLVTNGTTVTASNLDWNSSIAPAGSVSFGFEGLSDGTLTQPTCTVN
mgnify:CR=1 FL=1